MTPGADPPHLVGRERELAAIVAVMRRAREGHSGALVIAGDAGVGKTALLDRAVADASRAGTRVERMVAAESEFELPYAGLHQLGGRLLDAADTLPDPQRAALDVAFGRSTGPPPTPFLVGLAMLGLLTEAAARGPLACVIDDAHWLDAASSRALTFAARRLQVEGIAVLFGTRVATGDLAALPTLALAGLADDDARVLLGRAWGASIDRRVRDQLIADARGNPLALLELPRTLSPADLAGGFALADTPALERRIEDSVLAELAPLSEAARTLLLLAAADPTGDPALLWAASAGAGITASAVADAEATQAVRIDTRVRFRHPLVRSAVYRAARADARRRAHALLADATDEAIDPDRRAWHRAHAATAPDEAVAVELERSAVRARGRGGAAAAAAFLQRAARLSLAPARQATRTLGAAQATFESGALEEARMLWAGVRLSDPASLDALLAERLGLEIEFQRRRDATATTYGLADVARRLAPVDIAHARETYRRAMFTALFIGRQPGNAPRRTQIPADLAQTVLDATVDVLAERNPAAVDLLLVGEAMLGSGDPVAGRPVIRDAIARLLAQPSTPSDLQWLRMACHAAIDVRDLAALTAFSERALELGRSGGELWALPLFLGFAGAANLTAGRLDAAMANLDELDLFRELTGEPYPPYHEVLTTAWCGDAAAFASAVKRLRHGAAERSEGNALLVASYAETILANGAREFPRAVEAWRGAAHGGDLSFSGQILGELVEAAVRVGDRALAAEALDELEHILDGVGGDWAAGTLAEARAQVLDGDDAEAEHLQAIERFERGGLAIFAARARLTYGERLRGADRRAHAREQLRPAYTELAQRGAAGFAARAARELELMGEVARRSVTRTEDGLTAHERNVVRLAREGMTNREIGARLFVSDRTVEYHLRKVFQKLEISSRRELPRVLGPSA